MGPLSARESAYRPMNSPGIWAVLVVCNMLLVAFFRTQGIVLALIITAVAIFFQLYRPDRREQDTLISSILLSREDITDVLSAYDAFLTSPDAKNLADRTLERPALRDEACNHPVIAEFRFLASTTRRFVTRVEVRLQRDLTIPQLEALLAVTDKRAVEIRDAWVEARRVAAQLGTNYNR